LRLGRPEDGVVGGGIGSSLLSVTAGRSQYFGRVALCLRAASQRSDRRGCEQLAKLRARRLGRDPLDLAERERRACAAWSRCAARNAMSAADWQRSQPHSSA
jgi:hypothetical protein